MSSPFNFTYLHCLWCSALYSKRLQELTTTLLILVWQLYIVGVPADSRKKKTRILEDDWCPVWDEEFNFPLTVPELALLRIEVREYDMSEKDDFGGQTCLPVSELRTGIRSVPLYDKKGHKMKSVRLLMRFQFL